MDDPTDPVSPRAKTVVTTAMQVALEFATRPVDFMGRPRDGTLADALAEFGLALPPRDPPERETLPDRRVTWSFDFQCQSGQYTTHVSYYPDGRLGEVWLVCDRPNSTADTLARDASLVLSIAIQFGVPLELLQRAMSRSPNGDPAGPLGVVLDRVLGRPKEPLATPGLDPDELSMPTAVHA